MSLTAHASYRYYVSDGEKYIWRQFTPPYTEPNDVGIMTLRCVIFDRKLTL